MTKVEREQVMGSVAQLQVTARRLRHQAAAIPGQEVIATRILQEADYLASVAALLTELCDA